MHRWVVTTKTGLVREETVVGITSLPACRASARCLAHYLRQHWHIENRSHYLRDVSFGEDHSLVRVSAVPHVMATIRNTAIALIRLTGTTTRLGADGEEDTKMPRLPTLPIPHRSATSVYRNPSHTLAVWRERGRG